MFSLKKVLHLDFIQEYFLFDPLAIPSLLTGDEDTLQHHVSDDPTWTSGISSSSLPSTFLFLLSSLFCPLHPFLFPSSLSSSFLPP